MRFGCLIVGLLVLLLPAYVSAAWSPFGQGLTDGYVYAQAEFNGRLVVGGNFIKAGGDTIPNIAQWDGTSWDSLGTGTSSGVSALVVFNGSLIVAGSFNRAGGLPAGSIAAWDGSAWTPLGTGVDNHIFAVAVYNGAVIAGALLYSIFDAALGHRHNLHWIFTGALWILAVLTNVTAVQRAAHVWRRTKGTKAGG